MKPLLHRYLHQHHRTCLCFKSHCHHHHHHHHCSRRHRYRQHLRRRPRPRGVVIFIIILLGHFEITPSGYILVKTALDAEMNSMFNLTIEAKDEGQPRRANTVSNNSLLSEFLTLSPFIF